MRIKSRIWIGGSFLRDEKQMPEWLWIPGPQRRAHGKYLNSPFNYWLTHTLGDYLEFNGPKLANKLLKIQVPVLMEIILAFFWISIDFKNVKNNLFKNSLNFCFYEVLYALN